MAGLGSLLVVQHGCPAVYWRGGWDGVGWRGGQGWARQGTGATLRKSLFT